MPKSGFPLDQIIHLHINFHNLHLTQGSSYTELSEQISRKNTVINPNNDNEKRFKWAVTAAVYHEEIDKDPKYTPKTEHYEDKCNWNGLVFPLEI